MAFCWCECWTDSVWPSWLPLKISCLFVSLPSDAKHLSLFEQQQEQSRLLIPTGFIRKKFKTCKQQETIPRVFLKMQQHQKNKWLSRRNWPCWQKSNRQIKFCISNTFANVTHIQTKLWQICNKLKRTVIPLVTVEDDNGRKGHSTLVFINRKKKKALLGRECTLQ